MEPEPSLHDTICQHLVSWSRRVILQAYNTASCIASTAIAIDVLRHYGIAARPLMVQTDILNWPMVQLAEKLGRLPLESERNSLDPSARITGIGYLPNGKPGIHLVAITEKRLLLDLSLDQASKPHYGMNLEPSAGYVSRDFVAGAARADYMLEDTQCLVIYKPQPWRLDYCTAADWSDVFRMRQRVVQTIINGIEWLEHGDQPQDPELFFVEPLPF